MGKNLLPPKTKTILRNREIKKLAIGTTCVQAIEHYLVTEDTNPTQSTEAEATLFDHLIIFAESIIYSPTFISPQFHLDVPGYFSPDESGGLPFFKEFIRKSLKRIIASSPLAMPC